MDETKKITIEINEEDLSEMNCMKCRVDDFKNSLCEGDFCKMYHGEGNAIDFINAVKASACPTVPVDDLISRQAAMEEISKQQTYKMFEGEDTVYIDANDVGSVIASLPSTQPEIIRCGQCKYAEVADKEDAQDGYTCQFHRGSIWFIGSYCSWAERKDNG